MFVATRAEAEPAIVALLEHSERRKIRTGLSGLGNKHGGEARSEALFTSDQTGGNAGDYV